MLLPESIKRAKGEGVKAEKRVIPLINTPPEELSINKEGDTTEWTSKWYHCDLQEKVELIKYQ